jgi:hypothetical protein
VWVKLTYLASWSVLSVVSGAYLTTKRGLRVDEVELLGLVVSDVTSLRRGASVGEVDLLGLVGSDVTSLRREASMWVKLISLASWSAMLPH